MGRETAVLDSPNAAVSNNSAPTTAIAPGSDVHLLSGLEASLSPLASISAPTVDLHHERRVQATMQGVLDRAKLQEDTVALARETSQANLPIELLDQRVKDDFSKLWAKYGDHLGKEELVEIKAIYSNTLSNPSAQPTNNVEPKASSSSSEMRAAREAQMKAEVEAAAKIVANQDFDKSPNTEADPAKMEQTLKAIAEKYRDVLDQKTAEAMLKQYTASYDAERNNLYDTKLAWYEKAWYGTCSLCSSAYNAGARVVSGIVALGTLALDAGKAVVSGIKQIPSLVESAVDLAVRAGNAIGSAAKSTYNFLTSSETWTAVGSGLSKAWDFVTSSQTWKAVGNAIVKGFENTLVGLETAFNNTKEFAVAVFTDPAKALTMLKNGAVNCWEATKTLGSWAWTAAGVALEAVGITALYNGTIKFVKETWNALGSGISTATGLVKDFALLAAGKITADQLKQNLLNGVKETLSHTGQALAGLAQGVMGAAQAAAVFFGSVPLGIAVAVCYTGYELVGAISSFASGNTGMGLLHLGGALLAALPLKFGRSLAKTEQALAPSVVKVAGAMATHIEAPALINMSKEALERAAQLTLSKSAKEITEKELQMSMKLIMEKAGVGSLDKLSVKEADKLLRTSMEHVGEHCGEAAAKSLANDLATKTAAQIAELRANPLLQEKLAHSHAFDVAEKEINTLAYKACKEPVKAELEAVEKMSAKQLASRYTEEGVTVKDAKQFLKALNNGKADAEIQKIIEEQLYKRLREPVIEGMKPGLDRALEKEMAQIAEKYGLSKNSLVKGAREGAIEGAEAGLRNGIRRAVKDAFDEFRARKHYHLGSGNGSSASVEEGLKLHDNGGLFHDPGKVKIAEVKRADGRRGYKRLDDEIKTEVAIDGPKKTAKPEDAVTANEAKVIKFPGKNDKNQAA